MCVWVSVPLCLTTRNASILVEKKITENLACSSSKNGSNWNHHHHFHSCFGSEKKNTNAYIVIWVLVLFWSKFGLVLPRIHCLYFIFYLNFILFNQFYFQFELEFKFLKHFLFVHRIFSVQNWQFVYFIPIKSPTNQPNSVSMLNLIVFYFNCSMYSMFSTSNNHLI